MFPPCYSFNKSYIQNNSCLFVKFKFIEQFTGSDSPYLLLSSQKATALAAATFRLSTP